VNRRSLIALASTAAVAWPLSARAQQSTMPLVGFLRSTSLAVSIPAISGFRQGLKEAGLNEGQNIKTDYRYADNQIAQLPALARKLIAQQPSVIVGNTLAALAAKEATATIPIVFVTGSDPIADGLVASLNRPGGNVTGVSFVAGALGAKRLEMLRQVVPTADTIAMLVGHGTLEAERERDDVEAAARLLGQKLVILEASGVQDLERAVAAIIEERIGALLVGSGPFLTSNREWLVAKAAQHSIPAFYALREFVTAGGLVSYGASLSDAYRQAPLYVARILKGERPADLPVLQATKFDLLINLRTANALGIEIPPKILALADEVIE
jgi:ABC-type uncharacterized transport system substrate-binding protein